MADDEKGCKNPECGDGDMIAVGPNLGGVCPFVRHRPDHSVETGLAKIAPVGTPTEGMSNPLYLQHNRDNLFNVKPLSKGGSDSASASGKGHSKAATPAYRDNWDTIFGKKAPMGQA